VIGRKELAEAGGMLAVAVAVAVIDNGVHRGICQQQAAPTQVARRHQQQEAQARTPKASTVPSARREVLGSYEFALNTVEEVLQRGPPAPD